MKKIILIFLLLLSGLSFSQVENSSGKYPPNSNPFFYFDVANYKGKSDSLTRVEVFLQVPYSKIQFLKTDAGYNGSYTVYLTFFDKKGDNIILKKIWTEKISSPGFNSTISNLSYNISYRNYYLPPGIYRLKIKVEDNYSKANGWAQAMVTVLSFKKHLDISDIMLVKKKISKGNIEKVVPNIARSITTKEKQLTFFYEIYSDTTREVKITYKILNLRKDTAYTESVTKKIHSGKNFIYQSLKNAELSLGNYSLIVKIFDTQSNLKVGIGKKFFARISSYPTSITDLDLAIDQMIYIASQNEINYIKAGKTYREKLRRYMEFWKKKDPSPNTEENEILDEYYRRVEYANAHFKGYYPGWRTDMGVVYITLGPPDQVERHPFEYDSKPYEIWYYYDLNRNFVFVDETGFGDYRLINPDYSDWYRYRY